MPTFLVALILLAFGAYSGYATWQVGYLGIFEAGFANPGALQILLDLSVACLILIFWMISDARTRGLNAWPFVVITLAAGSFGPLLYLLYRNRRAGATQAAPGLA